MAVATPIPFVKATFFDRCGKPLAGGKVYTYEPRSTTPKATYKAPISGTPNTNPIILDAAGQADIYLAGRYRIRITTSNDVIVADNDDIGSWYSGDLDSQLESVNQYLMDSGDALVASQQARIDEMVNTGLVGAGSTDLLVALSGSERSQYDKNSDTISLLDKIPISQISAIKNRTSTYDCMPALAACIATGKRVIIPLSGKYMLKTAYSGNTDFDVEATAPDVIFDFTAASATVAITNMGSLTQVANVSSNLIKGTCTLNMVSVVGLVEGDWICIYNPADYSYSGFRSYYRAGEWKQVLKITGQTVTTTQPFYEGYLATSVSIYKLNSVRCRIANLSLVSNSTNPHLIKFALSSSAIIDRIRFKTAYQSAIWLDTCIMPIIDDVRGINYGTADGETDYGILIGNCQHVRLSGGDIYGRRHAIGVGGGDKVCGVPVRDMRVRQATLRNDPTTIVGAADMHGNVEDSSYEDCTIYGGGNFGGGGDNFYRRCTVYSDQTSGRALYFREVKGGKFGVYDCEFNCLANPANYLHGVFDLGGNSDVFTTNTTKDFTFECKRNTLKSDVFSGTIGNNPTILFNFRNAGTSVKINFDIDDNTFKVNSYFELLRTALSLTGSGTASSDYIVIDNIKGRLPVNPLITHVGGSYLNFPHRVQRQTGVIALTTIAQLVTTAPTTPYGFVYPRRPTVQLSLRGTNGGNSEYGGQVVMAHCIALSSASLRPQIKAPALMTAGDTFEICWSVEICEC